MASRPAAGPAPPAIAVKRWAVIGGFAAALAFALPWLRPADEAPEPLPPALRDEPDVYMEAPVITQFGADGAIRYRLAAAEIRQFDRERVATIAAPALLLYPRDGGAPWHITSATGELREWAASAGDALAPTMGRAASEAERETALAAAAPEDRAGINAEPHEGTDGTGTGGATPAQKPGGQPEEQQEELLLRDDVALRRDYADGRFVTLKTTALRVHPERQRADTDQPVIIETASSRTTAAGFEGDLERGWMQLYSAPSQRVQVVALPNRSNR